MNKLYKVGISVVCLGAAMCTQGAIVLNGSFEEDPVNPSLGYRQVMPTGWSSLGNNSSVDLILSGYGGSVAAAGSQFLDLIGNDYHFPSGLKQSIYLEAGSYALAFYYNGGGGGKLLDYSLGSLISGQIDTTGMNVYGSSHTQWEQFNSTFVVSTAGYYDLQFSTPNPGIAYPTQAPFIDDVSITAVPEPGTLASGALLLLPLGIRLYRRLKR